MPEKHIYNEIEENIFRKRKNLKREGFFWLFSFLITFLLLAVIFDNIFLLPEWSRWLIWLAMLMFAGFILAKLWLIPSRNYSAKQAIDDLENEKNDSEQLLRTAFEIEQKKPENRNLIETEVLQSAKEKITNTSADSKFRKSHSRRFWFLKRLSIAFFIIIMVNGGFRTGLIRTLLPFIDMHYTRITTHSQQDFFPGDEVQISARVKGKRAKTATLYVSDKDTIWEQLKINTNNKKHFQFNLRNRKHKFKYYLTLGDGKSAVKEVNLIAPPEIDSIWAEITCPEYMRKPKAIQTGGHLKTFEGAQVDLHIKLSQRMKEGFITLPNREKAKMSVNNNHLSYRFQMPDTVQGEYRIIGLDAHNTMLPEQRFKIRSLKDKLPSVKILDPSKDIEATALTEIPIKIYAYDDIGLGEIGLVAKVDNQEKEIKRFNPGDSVRLERTEIAKLLLEEFDVNIQSNIRVYAWAKDRNPKQKKRGVSVLRAIDIRPFRYIFKLPEPSSASSAKMQQKQEKSLMKLEEMIQVQRNVLSKAFKIIEEGSASDEGKKLSKTELALSDEARAIYKEIGGGGTYQSENLSQAGKHLEKASVKFNEDNFNDAFDNGDQALNILTKLRNNLLRELKKSKCKSSCKNSYDILSELAMDVDKLVEQEKQVFEKHELYLVNKTDAGSFFESTSLQNKTLIDAKEFQSMLEIHPDGTKLNLERMEEAISTMNEASNIIEEQKDARDQIIETITRLQELAVHLRGMDKKPSGENIKKARQVVEKTAKQLEKQAKDKKTIGRKDCNNSRKKEGEKKEGCKKPGDKEGEKPGSKSNSKGGAGTGTKAGNAAGETEQMIRQMEMVQDWLNSMANTESDTNKKNQNNQERLKNLIQKAEMEKILDQLRELEKNLSPVQMEQLVKQMKEFSQMLKNEELNLTMSKLDRLAAAKKTALNLKKSTSDNPEQKMELLELLKMFDDDELNKESEQLKGMRSGQMGSNIENIVARLNALIDELLKDEITNESDIRVPSKYKRMVEEYFKALSDDIDEESDK